MDEPSKIDLKALREEKGLSFKEISDAAPNDIGSDVFL